MRLIIVSGLSGSGKTVALHVLEDLDFYCIDNLPAALLDTLVSRFVDSDESTFDSLAVGIDARNRAEDLASLPTLIRKFRDGGVSCEVVFLQAEDEILLKRYSETRRKHPLADKGLSLQEAIGRERELLGPIIDTADIVIDTTRTNVYQLRDTMRERIRARSENELSILIQSFGFKHGVPTDADFVFDLRCLPNPYWETQLRPLTGKDAAVAAYLDDKNDVQEMYADILAFLNKWIPNYVDFHRNYLTVALGCTGGQHRSVYMVEKLAVDLGENYPHVLTRHNELPDD
ncbi:MAG: RNase adapter RapZ [Gammaproteobacteria bacterium]